MNEELNKSNILTTNQLEKIMAFVMIPVAYIYVSFMFEDGITSRILLSVFTIGFIVFCEAMFYEKKRSRESIIFIVMTLIIGASYLFGVGAVWDEGSKQLFLHMYAVYWVLCRSECLVEGKTSHLFVFDGINGFILLPIGNFLLNIMTILSAVFNKEKRDRKRVGTVIIAVAVGVVLLIIAISFLSHSDENFSRLVSVFRFDFNWEYIVRFIICLFVASYLYGLVGGCYRTKQGELARTGGYICSFIESLKKVPTLVWVIFIIIFSIIYGAYYVLQGSYIFNAFGMILPEQYTFSEYARRGFSDMIAVMIVNYVLFWISDRTSEHKTKSLLIADTVLMGESIMFAVIAFLKLLMYIKAYGFTPLRLQSVWLVLVLMYACVCILVNMYTGRKTVDKWFIGSAAALSLLTWI